MRNFSVAQLFLKIFYATPKGCAVVSRIVLPHYNNGVLDMLAF